MNFTRLLPRLRCLACGGGNLAPGNDALSCAACGRQYPLYNGVPIMTLEPEKARAYTAEVVVENHYSAQWRELIRRAGDGCVLDLGSGNNPDAFDNVVKVDVFPLPHVDCVAYAEALPFRDGVFHAVISGAVFEHVRDPFKAIAEVHRTLRAGGCVYIETAFLQPVHAFPGHYFNMTRMGLEELCRAFERIDAGVQPHQYPSFALKWFLEAMAERMSPPRRRAFLQTSVEELIEEHAADPFSRKWLEGFTREDLEQLACGVYFYGRKPGPGGETRPLPSPAPPAPAHNWRTRLRPVKRWLRRWIP